MRKVKKPFLAPGIVQPISKTARIRLTRMAKSLMGKELFPESVYKAKKTLEKIWFLYKE